jgi:hypothetical protein
MRSPAPDRLVVRLAVRSTVGQVPPATGASRLPREATSYRPIPSIGRSRTRLASSNASAVETAVGWQQATGRWSQFSDPPVDSDPVIGPLSWGDGGAPRGIRTPNRQIRSQPSPVPARPPEPFPSPFVLVDGHLAGAGRTSVPVCPAWLGRNVVAVSGGRRQTGSLVTCRSPGRDESTAPDFGSGALTRRAHVETPPIGTETGLTVFDYGLAVQQRATSRHFRARRPDP